MKTHLMTPAPFSTVHPTGPEHPVKKESLLNPGMDSFVAQRAKHFMTRWAKSHMTLIHTQTYARVISPVSGEFLSVAAKVEGNIVYWL